MCLTLSVAPLHVRQTGRTLENANSAHRRQEDPSCRRAFGIQVARSIGFLCSGSLIATPSKVLAASQIESDKSKLYEGYEKLTYFLDNWVKETTVCGRSGDNPYISKGGCERTPEKVMDYLGYKSMNHPLFRADVTMRRLESLVPEDRESEYLEAIEKWMEAADAGNGLAFVSSWGEANPGGGKDRVELFLDRSKKSVVEARDSLATILNILQITKAT
jgi:hypothetical protein